MPGRNGTKSQEPNSGSLATGLPQRDASGRLLRLFSLLSVCAALAILIIAGYGIYRVYSSEMTSAAEATAAQVGESIFEQERAILLQRGGKGTVVMLKPDDFQELDLRMRNFLRTFNMHKIKVFSADKTIVYSTDAKIIGMKELENAALSGALSEGTVVSHLEFKNTVRDLRGEERFGVDVVETYVPIRVDNFIVGAFEMYSDVSSNHGRLRQTISYSLAVLAVVLAAVFAALYMPMYFGMARLRDAEAGLHELASIDELTGIFNRRHVLERVEEERARMLRVGGEASATQMALLMVDIDHFKAVNDSHGHLAGDAVLRAITARLEAALRSYDFIGRFGGEEFLVTLPETGLAAAMLVAERMRASICEQPVRCANLELPLSVSIGVATPLDAHEPTAQILSRADQGLYLAKQNGRNRVCRVQPVTAAL